MIEERLRRAAGALERSVEGVDVLARLAALERRRRRQRATTVVLAAVAAAAVLAGVVFGVRTLRAADPAPGPPSATGYQPAPVEATIPVTTGPVAVATGAGAIWVASTNPAWVSRVDSATGDRLTIAVPPVPTRLAATEDAVRVLCPDDGSLSRIDPLTNELVATIPVGRAPSGLAVGQGAVWVTSSRDGTVARIDPASNRLTVAPVPRCRDGDLAGGEGALWVANRLDGTLVRVDPASGRVAARVLLPRTTDQEPHQVAVGDGAVWAAGADLDSHFRVQPG